MEIVRVIVIIIGGASFAYIEMIRRNTLRMACANMRYLEEMHAMRMNQDVNQNWN